MFYASNKCQVNADFHSIYEDKTMADEPLCRDRVPREGIYLRIDNRQRGVCQSHDLRSQKCKKLKISLMSLDLFCSNCYTSFKRKHSAIYK